MTKSWTNSEKGFLANLFSKMGNTDFLWRDDAIIVPIDNNNSLLYSIDNGEQIFSTGDRAKDMRLYGRWTASLVASDIIACGVMPNGLAIDLGIKDKDEMDCENFIEGVLDVCKHYDMKYEGGNINTTDSISGVAWGYSESNKIIRREGAKPGDIIFVTCDLGIGWADKLLRNSNQPSLIHNYKEFPVINTSMFKEVWKLDAIHCGMDLTDGIIEFAYEINDRTGYGVTFDPQLNCSDLISLASSKLNIPEVAFRFEPGYDTPFAHGWCIDSNRIDEVIRIFEKYNANYTIMGEVEQESTEITVNYNSKKVRLPRYSDDIICSRGSVSTWLEQIYPLFN